MLELTPSFFAVAVPAVIFAGISKGGFGSGAAFASSTILALFLPPGIALGVMLPLLMLIDVASLRPYWRRWSWPDARVLLLGGVPGVILGGLLYQVTNDDVLRFIIGMVALAFVAWQAALARGWVKLGQQPLPTGMGYVLGVLVGFTSFVSHAGGPPAAVYLLGRKLDKTTYQASTVLIFWIINILKFVPYAFLGIFTWQTLLADLFLVPAALIGTWLGVKAHRMIPERLFFAVTYVLLTATGVKLIWEALA